MIGPLKAGFTNGCTGLRVSPLLEGLVESETMNDAVCETSLRALAKGKHLRQSEGQA